MKNWPALLYLDDHEDQDDYVRAAALRLRLPVLRSLGEGECRR